MNDKPATLTGAALIFLGVYLNIPFSILGAIFNYPDVLRKPTAEVLTQFHAGGTGLLAAWYAFAAAPLLMLFVVLLVDRMMRHEKPALLAIAKTAGVLAAVLQLLGLIRWVFVVPYLAEVFTDPAATQAGRDAAVVVFQALHRYAGVAIGEHLGQLFTAVWGLSVSAAMFDSRIFSRRLGAIGVATSLAMLLGLIEGFSTVVDFDASLFGKLQMASFIALSLWMIAVGIHCLRSNRRSRRTPATAPNRLAGNQ
ncbi:MAG: DUF4386 domain-containing protein [Blastocatellia bacterium]|nr:DUF4386 domain-containing protein [Blastocatellia bacterium]